MRALLVLILAGLVLAPSAFATSSRSAFLDTADGTTHHDLATGAFTLARSTTDPFEVQVRRDGGANRAVAVRLNDAGDVFAWDPTQARMWVNRDEFAASADTRYEMLRGGVVTTGPVLAASGLASLTFASERGDVVAVAADPADGFLTVTVTPAPASGRSSGIVSGLLGDLTRGRGLVDRDGASLGSLATAQAVWAASPSFFTPDLVRDFGYCNTARASWTFFASGVGETGGGRGLTSGRAFLDAGLTPLPEPAECPTDYRNLTLSVPATAPNGVEVTRRLMWSWRTSFLRVLTTLRNPTDHAITTSLYQRFDGPFPALKVLAPTVDGVVRASDDWFTAGPSSPVGGDLTSAIAIQGPGRRDGADRVYAAGTSASTFTSGQTDPVVAFDAITIPARGAATYLTAVARTPSEGLGNAPLMAAGLAAPSPEVMAHLTPLERITLRNFTAPDADWDGIANADDPCPYAPTCPTPPRPDPDPTPVVATPRADPPAAPAPTPAPGATPAAARPTPAAPRSAPKLTVAARARARLVTVTGRLLAVPCANATVTVRIARGGRTVATRTARTTATCTFRTTVRPGRGALTISARGGGAAPARTSLRVR